MPGNHEALNGLRITEFKKDPESIRYIHMTEKKAKHRAPDFREKYFIYCFLVFFIILMAGIELISEVRRSRLQEQIVESITSRSLEHDNSLWNMSEAGRILQRLQNRVILVVAVLFLCVVASMFLFYRNFIRPVDEIGKAVYKMANGHLDSMVPVCSGGEIGKIGELINDLAINLQEILLHVWNHTGQDIVLLDRIVKVCGTKSGGNGIPDEIKNDLRIVRQDIEDMQNMVKAFDYYNIRFEKEKIIAGEKHNPEKL